MRVSVAAAPANNLLKFIVDVISMMVKLYILVMYEIRCKGTSLSVKIKK
jgi:hypothetical protein